MARAKSVAPDFLNPDAEATRKQSRQRIQVNLDVFTKNVLDKLPGDTDAERVGTLCRRLEYFRLAAVRRLAEAPYTPGEWVVMVLALKGAGGVDEYDSWKTVLQWAYLQQQAFQQMYGIDPVETAQRLRDQGDIGSVAVRETVDRYWMLPAKMRHADRLLSLGVIDRAQAKEWTASEAERKRRQPAARKTQQDANQRELDENSQAREAKTRRILGE